MSPTKNKSGPTPYQEVNTLIHLLLERVRVVLGEQFTGMYLDGSLANGGFDQDSDIDFVVVTGQDVSGELFLALQVMHDELAAFDSIWAIQLEGSYISQRGLRRYDPAHARYPNIERGQGERLKMADHDQPWGIHRYLLRQRGITVYGPDPQSLIDPVSPHELRRAMLVLLRGWAARFLDYPQTMASRGYQSYVVLSLCRALYTLQHGEVVSKPEAARWAGDSLGAQWQELIAQAWVGRHSPAGLPDPQEVEATLALIRFALARCLAYDG